MIQDFGIDEAANEQIGLAKKSWQHDQSAHPLIAFGGQDRNLAITDFVECPERDLRQAKFNGECQV